LYKRILIGFVIGPIMYHYLGINLRVPPGVYPPSDDSLLLADTLEPTGRILEVGTGSGIIAIHLARKGHKVIATDVNPHAVEAATENARRNGVEDRVDVVRTDLMNGLKGPFDTVVFNPPYLPSRPLGELRGIGELEAVTQLGGPIRAHGLEHLDRYSWGGPEPEDTRSENEDEDKEEEDEKEPEDWMSRSWQGGKHGAEVIDRFMGELPSHLAKGGKGYIVVSSLTDVKIPPESGLECRIVAERNFDFERLFILEVFRSGEKR